MEPSDPTPTPDPASEEPAVPGPETGKTGQHPRSGRRPRRTDPLETLERIAEVHYCRSDEEANQYLALGPEWDLQDIIPMRVETEDGGDREEVHFVVVRWESERDRARLRRRDRRGTPRSTQRPD